MSIKLAKIPEPPADFTFPTILEDDLYGQSYFIDPVSYKSCMNFFSNELKMKMGELMNFIICFLVVGSKEREANSWASRTVRSSFMGSSQGWNPQ